MSTPAGIQDGQWGTRGATFVETLKFHDIFPFLSLSFGAPPVQIEGRGLDFTITALNARGEVLLDAIHEHLSASPGLFRLDVDASSTVIRGSVIPAKGYFAEEERSKQPTLFSLVRSIRDLFFSAEPDQLGLIGSFGYDLTFQFGK